MVRLQKFLAEAGVASRRAGEQMILARQVAVNGEIVTVLGTRVDPDHDRVTVEGKPVRVKRKLYVALNKPPRLVCSRKDEFDRSTIFELLPKEWGHLHSVGRLDYNSEGLIFLTNDGDFSLHLTHPRYGVRKKYIVTVEGRVGAEMLSQFTRGLVYQGDKLKAEKALLISASKAQSVVELELTSGRNREVRRLLASQRLTVLRLQRVCRAELMHCCRQSRKHWIAR